MTIDEAHAEVKHGWAKSYSPEAIAKAVGSVAHKPLGYRINILIARLCFRGNLFSTNGALCLVQDNRRKPPHYFQFNKGRFRGSTRKRTKCSGSGSFKFGRKS